MIIHFLTLVSIKIFFTHFVTLSRSIVVRLFSLLR